LLPIGLIKIHGQKETRLVEQHGVNAHNKIPLNVVLAGEMPAHDLIGNRKKSLVEASATFDCGLSTHAIHPLVAAGGLVSTFSGLATFKASGVNVIATAKQ
jgi:hypothetical protein